MVDPTPINEDVINVLSAEFDTLCENRHLMGAQQYGALAFLENDMYQFISEELADLANYARYLYIKVRLIQELTDAGAGSQGQGGSEGSQGTYGPTNQEGSPAENLGGSE